MQRVIILLGITLLLFQCRQEPPVYQAEKSQIADSAMVVSPHPLSSEAGLYILSRGGNAVDAAIAVQLAMAVVYPRAGNIGGGGFMVLREPDGTATTLDYRERAPGAAHRRMYQDSTGEVIPDLSTRGHLAVGVPGTVAGLVAAHERYGSLPWAELVEPAIELAEKGYRLSVTEAERISSFQEDFRAFNNSPNPFIGDDFSEGFILQQPDLAATLTRIRDEGRDGFYSGETARLLVAEMEASGGLISARDLQDYEATWREPIVGEYGDYRILSMPPSSSGGVALVQMMGMVEPYPLADYGFQSTASVHLMVEAMRRAYADRAQHMGDTDFYPVPLDSLLDPTYLTGRMADFRPDTVTVNESIGAGDFVLAKESFETTHISIVDPEGRAVSVTTTLNSNFGSKVMVDGAGFFLNNEMDDFSAKPGVPNQFGLIGTEANSIAPGKRMLSSMTPTIVEKNGELYLVLGAPGGSTIITAVFQVILNCIEYGMAIDEAVNAPRFHHQWLPNQIRVEADAIPPAVRDSLQAMGHEFREVERMAVVKAIRRLDDGRLHGAADSRNPDDDVAGF